MIRSVFMLKSYIRVSSEKSFSLRFGQNKFQNRSIQPNWKDEKLSIFQFRLFGGDSYNFH